MNPVVVSFLCSIRFSRPVLPPRLKQVQLSFREGLLAGRESVFLVEVPLVLAVTEQHEQMLVIQHEIRPFVEAGQLGEGIFQFVSQPSGFDITGCSQSAKCDEMKHFSRQAVADSATYSS